MILPDINLLVYAYNKADPQHREAKTWWEKLLNGDRPVALPWIVSTGFIRLVTHPRILKDPIPVATSTSHVRSWLEQPAVMVIEPAERFETTFLRFLDELGTGGNLVTDAYLAALAVEHQAELHSNDLDFQRFHGLRFRNPLESVSS